MALHRCGWTHGDISLNIVMCGDYARIIDLEYATYKDEVREHDRVVMLGNFLPLRTLILIAPLLGNTLVHTRGSRPSSTHV